MIRCTLSWPMVLLLLLVPGFAAAQAEKPVDVAGPWEMTAETPIGNFTSTMKLERRGDQLMGVSIGQDGKETKLNDVKLAGKTLTFSEDVSFDGEEYHVVYTGAVAGDSIRGTFQTGDEIMNWSAKRGAPTAAVPGAAAPGSATGTWKISIETPNGTRERTLTLKQQGEQLAGTITGPVDQSVAVEDVSFKGKELRFTVPFERNGETIKRTFVAAVDGDSLTGTIEGSSQTRRFTGKRQAAPATSSLAGTWKLAVQAPNRTYHPTITLSEQEGQWSGKLIDEQGDEATLKELTVKSDQLDFTADLDVGGNVIHLKFSGALQGDQLKGSMEANDSKLPTTGERASKA